MTQYTYERSTDGTESAIFICDPTGRRMFCSHYWESDGDDPFPCESDYARAEADARLIVDALNASRESKDLLNRALIALSMVRDNETAMRELRPVESAMVRETYNQIADHLFATKEGI